MLHSDPGCFWLSLPHPSDKHLVPDHSQVSSPLGVLPAPETGFGWASKLIARDVKNIFRAKKASLTKKLDKALGSAHRAADKMTFGIIKAGKEVEAKLPSSDLHLKLDHTQVSDPPALKAKKSQHIQKPSLTSTIETANPRVFTPEESQRAADSLLTQPSTPVRAPSTPNSEDAVTPIDAAADKKPSIYHLMEQRLKCWYETRPFGLPHEERWKNRAMFLLLSMFVDLSPHNPIYDKFRNGREGPDQEVLIQQLRKIGSKPGGESVLMALHPLTARISSMPADIYTNTDNATAVRVDSAHSTASSTSWPSWRKRNGESGDGVPAPADLWAAILVAVTYRSVTEEIVEALMHEIFPDMDVKSFLVRRGDPAERFTDAENDIIRAKMRSLLDPDYEELWKLK